MQIGYASSYTSPALVSMRDNTTTSFEVTKQMVSTTCFDVPTRTLNSCSKFASKKIICKFFFFRTRNHIAFINHAFCAFACLWDLIESAKTMYIYIFGVLYKRARIKYINTSSCLKNALRERIHEKIHENSNLVECTKITRFQTRVFEHPLLIVRRLI